jgi:hypothetical protein
VSEHHYRLHDLSVRIQRPRHWPPWVFQKLDYFKVGPAGEPDIEIVIGPFDESTGQYANVDHRYYVRPGQLYFVGRWNSVRYATRWSGLDGDKVKVELNISSLGLLRFPWLQQADWITHMFILKPVTELLWARRGRFIMHAAAAARGGRAAVFTGFGSSLKTGFVMSLVRDGWQLLGDDEVLLTDDGLLPMPIGLRTFDFRVSRLPDEYLTRWRTLRLGVHLLRRVEPTVRVAKGPVPIGAVNLLTRSDRDAPAWETLPPDDAAARIVAQCHAETVQSVRRSPPIGEPLMAMAMVDDAIDVDGRWSAMRASLVRHLRDAQVRRVDCTRRWRGDLVRAVALGTGNDARGRP